MRATLALGLIGLGVLLPGCSLVGSGVDHVLYAVTEAREDRQERARNAQWAEAAWNQVAAAHTDTPYSEDYARGFTDGFAHYLYTGGACEPPPLPPRSYRALRYQTPQGYRAIEDWFAGWRHGTAVARQGPYRDWVTGPSALRAPAPTLQLEVAPADVGPPPPPEELPPPRPAPPAPAADEAPKRAGTYFQTMWRSLSRGG